MGYQEFKIYRTDKDPAEFAVKIDGKQYAVLGPRDSENKSVINVEVTDARVVTLERIE